MLVRTGKLGQDSWNRTYKTGQPRQGSWDRTTGTGTTMTGQPSRGKYSQLKI